LHFEVEFANDKFAMIYGKFRFFLLPTLSHVPT